MEGKNGLESLEEFETIPFKLLLKLFKRKNGLESLEEFETASWYTPSYRIYYRKNGLESLEEFETWMGLWGGRPGKK